MQTIVSVRFVVRLTENHEDEGTIHFDKLALKIQSEKRVLLTFFL